MVNNVIMIKLIRLTIIILSGYFLLQIGPDQAQRLVDHFVADQIESIDRQVTTPDEVVVEQLDKINSSGY